MMLRTYTELISLPTFEERLRYLQTNSTVGRPTFGDDRYVNQAFYTSYLWTHDIRKAILLRDQCCDLAVSGYDDNGGMLIVHHMNPITIDDILQLTPLAIDPEYLITTTDVTHRMIHYSSDTNHPRYFVERRPNDTCPWRS